MGEVVVNSEEVMAVEVEAEKRDHNDEKDEEEEENDGSKEVVRWESYLPRMVFRVLLVEADDSTRQIVTALLRKCGYKVSAVTDGLKAWETLKERARNIDLILTEMELPSISGFALLSLVTEHEVCKNIPVIMMSSQDSVSMVFKCMLKGAADYLIKPLRRNELRNLWQHVWRKRTLPKNTTAPQHGVEPASEINTASNQSSDYVVSIKNIKECSEKGSDSQGSCTMPHLEAKSEHVPTMQDISQMSRSAAKVDRNNVQSHEDCTKLNKESVIHANKTGDKSNIFKPEVVSCNGAFQPTVLGLKEEYIGNKRRKLDETSRPENCEVNANANIQSCCDELLKPSCGAIDLIGTFDDHPRWTNKSDDRCISSSEYPPQLELSLRGLFLSSSNSQGTGERPKLNHSNASAFSWYGNSNTLRPLFPNGQTTPEDGPKKSPELIFTPSFRNSTVSSQQHAATRSYCHYEMPASVAGQSGHTVPVSFPSTQLGTSPDNGLNYENSGYNQLFPSFYTQSSVSSMWGPISENQQEKSPFAANTASHSDPEIQHSEQGYQLSEEATHKSADQTKHDQKELDLVEEVKPSSFAADQCHGGSFCYGVGDQINSDDHGSSCGRSDGYTNSSSGADEKTTASRGLNDNGHFVYDSFRGMDFHRISQREAALIKFRMKRKDRCFEKKVRYQSRKRLAEQRPRVKGQFVRQGQTDPPTANST
ncbi:two-component response regulator-like PRR95 [Humulus lupulus]|uniref:two-component response regulator-like PRR95 n=1 Tax=Humulus lupulus TaxID=3486 RepID=UPI002B40EF1D|nr:two-component response regulator-like PRR95 [Humulus lupulus]XP_062091289.1 two-component response regulator-like PRR95 [Humulus lupulus]